jgi:hypothetical protein
MMADDSTRPGVDPPPKFTAEQLHQLFAEVFGPLPLDDDGHQDEQAFAE